MVLCYHIKAEYISAYANMAQVVEQLTRNEQVEGSSPSIGSLFVGADGTQEVSRKADERQRLIAIAERSPARAPCGVGWADIEV